MKQYRQLIKEMPSKKVVFAFGRFQPPTTGHELLVNAVKKIAQKQGADHIIFASRTHDKKANPLPVDRKVYYLKRMFPNTNFVAANEEIRTFMEAAKMLSKKYKHLIMLAGSDRVQEYKKLLDKYNGDVFTFDTIEVVSAGERDPDADSASGMSGTKMRDAAKKGEFSTFKKGLPHTLTEIDGKRLMNEIRQGMGMEVIREQIKFETNELREKYHAGEIYNVGDKVTDGSATYEIVDRGANYITVVNEAGSTSKKWLDSVFPTHVEEDVQPGYAPEEISFKGYTTKNLHHSEDAAKSFQETIDRYNKGHIKDAVAILNALKATDAYMKVNDLHLAQQKPPTSAEIAVWHDAHDKARESLNRIGEFMHHFDYWHMHEHEIQDLENNFTPETQGAEFADSFELEGQLIEMKFNSADKIKVARIIAATLGIEDVEKSSNPEQLVNNALRKIRSKPMRPEYIDVIHSMLKTATEAGIKFDEKLVPQKVAKVDEASKPSALERYRALAAEREKKHDEIEAKRKEAAAQGKENMSGAIDRLEKSLNKEEVEELEEAHKIGDKVKIVSGSAKGTEGTIGEIRHGLYKGAPKTFTVYHSKNGATQVKKQHIRSVKEEVEELEESHVEFRIDHRESVKGDTKSTFATHDAKVSDQSDKATYVKVPSHKADSFKSAMKSKHGVSVELTEETIEEDRGNADKHWDIAQGHKEKASLSTKGSEQYHSHMAAHHDSMANYHSQIGQSSQAEAHSNKADIHHEKSYQASNESVQHKISDILEQISTAKLVGKPTNELQRKLSIARSSLSGEPEEHQTVSPDNKENDSDIIADVKPISHKSSEVGHTMTSPEENPALRKMKIRYVHEASTTADDMEDDSENPLDLTKTVGSKGANPAQAAYVKEEDEDEEKSEEIKGIDDLSDDDLEDMAGAIDTEDDVMDAYDDEELAIVDDETGEHIEDLKEEVINEVLSRIERIKAKTRFARTKSKRERRTRIALKTRSTSATLTNRARKLAIKLMKSRIAKKPLNTLSIGEKERLERIIARRKNVVNRLAMKLVSRVRKIENDRLSHKKYTK
jgi:nicotinamide mononucleotide adenylyltransferase